MGNEDLVLSEYLDGELPQDIRKELEKRLSTDKVLSARLETLKSLKLPAPDSGEPDFQAQAVRVWNRLEWATRGKPRRSSFRRFLDFFTRSISLPVPALAAVALVVGVLGGIAVLRSGGAVETGVAAMPMVNSEPVVFPSLSTVQSGQSVGLEAVANGANAAPVSTDFPAQAESSAARADLDTHGLAVTFEVENLQELLRILEGREGIQELKITLPANQSIAPLGEPVLMKASELESAGGKP